jgi:hypothetical protein
MLLPVKSPQAAPLLHIGNLYLHELIVTAELSLNGNNNIEYYHQ